MTRPIVLLGVPIDCVSAETPASPAFGTELGPVAFRAAGVRAALVADDAGDADVRLVGRDRDPATGVLGWPSVAATTSGLRAAVAPLVRSGALPVLLGGCCTLVPGAMAGARDVVGDVGLVHVDGHLDLYDGRTSPGGEAADMPVAVVTGLGPRAWSEHVGAPLSAPDRVVLVGPRDREEAVAQGSVLPEDLGLPVELTPDDLRAAGPAAAGEQVRERLAGTPYWVHVDVDVLDEAEFPATDVLMPHGLTLAELVAVLGPLGHSADLAGLSIGCYNPTKDHDEVGARQLVDLLVAVLR